MAQEDRNTEGGLISPVTDEVKTIAVEILESGNYIEAELEDILVGVPELLNPAPYFCGRQLITDWGKLDLFGFGGADADFSGHSIRIREAVFPTVYELKVGRITGDALLQVIEYSKCLEAMTAEDLVWQLVINSGKPERGIPRIWEPKKLLDLLDLVWERHKIIHKVVVGASYDARIERRAAELDIKLHTVRELCAGYRERFSVSE